jgi:hypothetical protein
VLALLLVWYSLNPTPRAIVREKWEDEPPDEKKQNLETQGMPATSPIAFRRLGELDETPPSSDKGEDNFEWPEFIDG